MAEENNNFFEEYIRQTGEYLDDRLLLLRLKSIKKTSSIIGRLMYIVLIMGLCLIIFLFSSVMLSFILGRWLHSNFAGFGIVTGLFIVALIIIIARRKQIQSKFFGSIIIDILTDKNDDKDEVA